MREKLKLLNPKNLEKEVHRYGYHWTWKSQVFLTMGALLGMGFVGIVFKLQTGCMVLIMAAMLFLLPVLVLDVFLKMYEQKRFSDAATYMEQMLYSFRKSEKVLLALKETRELFEDGQMREYIQKTVHYIERGQAQTQGGILREALAIIEGTYDCTKLRMVHELLISAETYGGKTEQSVFLLLEDLELWKRRCYQLQRDKKISHRDNMISIVVATTLCGVALYVLEGMKGLFVTADAPFDIFEVPVIQYSSLLFLLFSLFVFARSTRNLSRNWLKEEGTPNGAYILESYRMIIEYDERREKWKSLLWAAPFLAGGAAGFFFGKNWLGIVCLAVACILLLQHRMGYGLAKKDVTEALYLSFPQWLMEMGLLLQENNVQVSILRSMQTAPEVLKPELEKLQKRLQEKPEKLSSYTDFCKEFDIPEAVSCMKMLHAIAEAGTANADTQIHELMKRVGEMQAKADEIRNRNISFHMKIIFAYPVMAATIKLLVDLTVGMIYMFQMLGSMGV